MSRRIVLRVLSRLAIYEVKRSKDGISEGRGILHQLALVPLDDLRLQESVMLSADKLFRVCECAFDLAFFSPELVIDLFNNHSEFGLLFECVIAGYSRLSFTWEEDSICHQVSQGLYS